MLELLLGVEEIGGETNCVEDFVQEFWLAGREQEVKYMT